MEDENCVPKQATIRHEWYQTESFVIITVLARNVKQDDLTIRFTEKNLFVSINLPTEGEKYSVGLNLAHKVVPSQSSYKLLSTKIEIKLKKLDSIHWSNLEIKDEHCQELKDGPPRYPSSNPLHRDWDAIERQIIKEALHEKPEGDDGVNKLFQKIYGDGSDDVKRAMNKSFIESGGTVLSTNWKDICKDKVPIKAPDGMEWKSWN